MQTTPDLLKEVNQLKVQLVVQITILAFFLLSTYGFVFATLLLVVFFSLIAVLLTMTLSLRSANIVIPDNGGWVNAKDLKAKAIKFVIHVFALCVLYHLYTLGYVWLAVYTSVLYVPIILGNLLK